MSEQPTCGTCANSNNNVIFCAFLNAHDEMSVGLHKTDGDPCDHYTARTDSLEQVAREMYETLRDSADTWCMIGGGWVDKIGDRLRDCGVDV